MTDLEHQVYLVDDDPAVLKALGRLLRSAGYGVTSFASAKEFMRAPLPEAPCCLVLDVTMPEISGLELQQWLLRVDNPLPIVFVTGNGEIPTSVTAMKSGAVDFLTKPVNEDDLLQAVEAALRRDQETRPVRRKMKAFEDRLATLTPREREVLEHVVSGQLNKQIAGALGTVEQTIKHHRGKLMEKTGVQSLAELVLLCARAGIGSGNARRPP
jgi:FixJ family two-component response regulator